MKIGIIGWYGHNNWGDERILSCLRKQLSGHDLFVIGDWGEARSKLRELNTCDFVIIGGGGLILRGCSAHMDIIEDLCVPFACLGISVEANHPEMRPFLDIILDRSERIVVRDSESKKIFGEHHKVDVAPDLTFLHPLKVVGPLSREVCGLNLRPWHYWQGQLHGFFHKLMTRLDRKCSHLETMYPLLKWQPEVLFLELNRHFSELSPLPFYFEDGVNNDVTCMQPFFNNLPTAYDECFYQGIRYLIGMRFHSLVFAVQAGIPFLSLSYQPKNENFCDDLGFSEFSIDIHRWKNELPGKIEVLKRDHKRIRDDLIECRDRCIQDIHLIMKDFSVRFV